MKEFNENPFKKDTSVIPFSNGTEGYGLFRIEAQQPNKAPQPLLHKADVNGSFIGRKITTGMMTSNTDLWETPQDFFDKMNEQYNFTLDVCALPENAKCDNYFTPKIDGLKQDWQKSWLEVASELCRVDDGLPKELDEGKRITALGNSIVPQIAYEIFKAIESHYENQR